MRVMLVSATLAALAACSSERRLLAPDHEAERIVSKEKDGGAEKSREVDPVCGQALEDADGTWASMLDGRVFFFDSEACKKQFDANPDLYRYTAR